MQPQLLTRYSNNVAGYLNPKSLQINLKADSVSTASMVLDNESPAVNIDDWVRIETPNHQSNVFTVKSISTNYVTSERTVSLEHGISLLNDSIAFGTLKPSNLGGSGDTVSISTCLQNLLSRQTQIVWSMGECEASTSQGWSFTNTSIYSAITSMMESVENCQLVTDQSAYPWKLHIRQYPTAVTMELRRSRNMDTMKTNIDRSGMFTRVYPTGAKNLNISSVNGGVAYLDKNTDRYGIVSKVLNDASIRDKKRLKDFGNKQLELFAHPLVNVSISGYDLSEYTGEPLDRMIIGRLCRVPIPELGETFTERVTELSWRDAIGQPDAVTVTLATVRQTVQSVTNKSSGGASSAAKEQGCDLEEQEGKVEEIIGSVLWTQKDNITAAVGELTVETIGGVKMLTVRSGTRLSVTNDGMRSEVVSAGNVLSAINQSAEEISISASKINLTGYVTASQLSALSADIDNLKTGVTTASMIKTVSLFATNSLFVGTMAHNATWQSAQLTDGTYIYYLGHQ